MGEQLESPCKIETQLDKLSSLPVHVIDQILSLLPIRDAVRTSVLSKKWRYKWATIPHLVFDNQCFSTSSRDLTFIKNKLVNVVDHVLLLHNGPILKFKLSHHDLSSVSDIDRWILYISRSSIKEFILDIWKGPHYKVPSSLFSCHNLIQLELYNCLLKPLSTFEGFRNLKRLDLQKITLSWDVFEILISSCPMLEWLKLRDFDGFKNLAGTLPGPYVDLNYINIDVNFNDLDKNQVALCLLRSSPNLQELVIEARPGETGTGVLTNFGEVDHWSAMFSQLRIVKIFGISGIRPELEFINYVLSNSPVLKTMTVKPAPSKGGSNLTKELLRFQRASVQAEIVYMDP